MAYLELFFTVNSGVPVVIPIHLCCLPSKTKIILRILKIVFNKRMKIKYNLMRKRSQNLLVTGGAGFIGSKFYVNSCVAK